MKNDQITFDNLPEAVGYLIGEISEIKRCLAKEREPPPDKNIPMGINEACKIVGKAKSTIYTLVRKGVIPCCKVGKQLYFYEDELLAWIASGRKKNVAQTKAGIESEMQKTIRHKPKKLNF